MLGLVRGGLRGADGDGDGDGKSVVLQVSRFTVCL